MSEALEMQVASAKVGELVATLTVEWLAAAFAIWAGCQVGWMLGLRIWG